MAFGAICPSAWEGLFSHLNARKHSESVLALGNLILEKSSSGEADFGLPSCLTVRSREQRWRMLTWWCEPCMDPWSFKIQLVITWTYCDVQTFIHSSNLFVQYFFITVLMVINLLPQHNVANLIYCKLYRSIVGPVYGGRSNIIMLTHSLTALYRCKD